MINNMGNPQLIYVKKCQPGGAILNIFPYRIRDS